MSNRVQVPLKKITRYVNKIFIFSMTGKFLV